MRRMVSIVCAAQTDLKRAIEKIEATEVEGYHQDLVEKDFDPTGRLINDTYLSICRNSTKLKEFHILFEPDHMCVDALIQLSPDIIYFHDHTKKVYQYLNEVSSCGIDAGICLICDQKADFDRMIEYAKYVKRFLILTVNPRSIGGAWLEFVKYNVEQALDVKKQFKIDIEIDGGCSKQVIERFSQMGIDAFVLGTKSGFFDSLLLRGSQF